MDDIFNHRNRSDYYGDRDRIDNYDIKIRELEKNK